MSSCIQWLYFNKLSVEAKQYDIEEKPNIENQAKSNHICSRLVGRQQTTLGTDTTGKQTRSTVW